jgi:hypothetical protein
MTLVVRGHSSHFTVSFVVFCIPEVVDPALFSSYTTHVAHEFDLACFGPSKAANVSVRKWTRFFRILQIRSRMLRELKLGNLVS